MISHETRPSGTFQACCSGGFDFYSMLRTWIGTERLSYLFYDDPALIKECLEFLCDYILRLYARAVRDVRFDYIIIHEDLAGKGGPLIGPNIFAEFFLPHYKRYLQFLKASGIQVALVDTDGDFEVLIVCALELKPDWTEAQYLLAQITRHAASDAFRPKQTLSEAAATRLLAFAEVQTCPWP